MFPILMKLGMAFVWKVQEQTLSGLPKWHTPPLCFLLYSRKQLRCKTQKPNHKAMEVSFDPFLYLISPRSAHLYKTEESIELLPSLYLHYVKKYFVTLRDSSLCEDYLRFSSVFLHFVQIKTSDETFVNCTQFSFVFCSFTTLTQFRLALLCYTSFVSFRDKSILQNQKPFTVVSLQSASLRSATYSHPLIVKILSGSSFYCPVFLRDIESLRKIPSLCSGT